MSLDAVTKAIEPDGIQFIGEKMEILINRMYEKYKLIEIGKSIQTVGIFEYRLGDNDTFHGFFFPGVIEILPSEIDFIKEGNDDLIKLTLYTGDMLMTSRKVVCNAQIAATCFSAYIEQGKLPKWIPYDKKSFIFDTLKKVTKVSFPTDHASYEIIMMHMTRCNSDIFKEFRYSEGNEEPVQLKLEDVAHAATSFAARSISGYLSDSINVMLTNKNEENSDLEDLLRGIPQSHNTPS